MDARRQTPERIVVKSDGEIVCLKPNEIDWAESAGNYVCLHVGAATHILRETITALESRLGARQFMRVHRSTLVNVDRIKTLKPSLYGDYSSCCATEPSSHSAVASAKTCSSDWEQPSRPHLTSNAGRAA